MKILNELLKLSIIFLLLVGTNKLNTSYKKPHINISKQESSISLNNELINFFSLGQNRMISSLIWIKTMLDSDLDHYKENDLNNWFYLNIRSINSLDPKFYEPYLYGGLYLSIVKDDDLGAIDIYERGLKAFENDYYLSLNAGFHSYFELKDKERAIQYYSEAMKDPRSPKNLPFLIARIESERDNLETAYEILQETYKTTPKNSPLSKKIKNDLYSIKAEIDLNCLNHFKQNCAKKDFNGSLYYLMNGKYFAKEKWEKFRIKNRPR